MWWIRRLQGGVLAPVAPPSYGLLGKKLVYGVDYGNYMHQLAAEIGAAPTIYDLLRRPKVPAASLLTTPCPVPFTPSRLPVVPRGRRSSRGR